MIDTMRKEKCELWDDGCKDSAGCCDSCDIFESILEEFDKIIKENKKKTKQNKKRIITAITNLEKGF